MNIILLSGGSGKRLWPLSNDVRSKQFLKLFKNDQDEYESMVQRVYRQLMTVDPTSNVTIATAESQVSSIKNQLSDSVSISIEPTRRDTFPAIALACSYLHDIQKVRENEIIIVCPVDPYVNLDYFKALKDLETVAKNGRSNLSLMGMEPTYPSEKYGYIIPETKESISLVKTFKEKPDTKTAEEYIRQGALWNGGIFAFRLSYILDKTNELLGSSDYKHLFDNYAKLEKISFDYAVVEKETSIQVLRFNGEWKDIGTWNTLTESMDEHVIGKGIIGNNCENVHIINELDVPVLAMGLSDVVISASPDGIIVSDKEQSSYIKPFVDQITEPIKFAEKSWGSYKVIDAGPSHLVIKVTLQPGHKMNYHYHKNRDESWIIVSGSGKTIINGKEKIVSAGDTITLKKLTSHTICAETEIVLIETQIGDDISVEDKYIVEI